MEIRLDWPVGTGRVLLSFSLSGPLVKSMYCGKTADLIEMPFDTVGRVRPI